MTIKIGFKHLMTLYCSAFALFTFYFIRYTDACEAYWMHDASIVISHRFLVAYCSYLFLIPAAFLILIYLIRLKLKPRWFIIHFVVAVVSASFLAVAIDRPCQAINGGHYMFVDTLTILGYYLFKLASLIILCILVGTTVFRILKLTQRRTS